MGGTLCLCVGGGGVIVVCCYAVLNVPSSFEINLMGRRELVALLLLYPWCFVTYSVMWLFLKMLRVGLECVIVVYPDYTHLYSKNYLESL